MLGERAIQRLFTLSSISAHILMERIKSEWSNREFGSDSGIHHTCFKGQISPKDLPQLFLIPQLVVQCM